MAKYVIRNRMVIFFTIGSVYTMCIALRMPRITIRGAAILVVKFEDCVRYDHVRLRIFRHQAKFLRKTSKLPAFAYILKQ